MQSFANAGGANHLVDDLEDAFSDEDESLEMIEFEPDKENTWHTDNSC